MGFSSSPVVLFVNPGLAGGPVRRGGLLLPSSLLPLPGLNPAQLRVEGLFLGSPLALVTATAAALGVSSAVGSAGDGTFNGARIGVGFRGSG